MGKFGDGKKEDGMVYVDERTKHLLRNVQDPKTLQHLEKKILADQSKLSKD